MRTLPWLTLSLAASACVSEHGPLTNRMAQSTTHYLTRAARQPVSWQPWGREAFALAARLDRPILLYVGAEECRWCAVMDREVYGDLALGAMIDSLFVPVRVDRDERPDVARRYEAAVQWLAGLRGYPVTVFLTPDGSAFFGGTYFPADDPVTGRGLKQLLPEVAKSYREQRGVIVQRAALVRQPAAAAPAPARVVLQRLARELGDGPESAVFADREAYVIGSVLEAGPAVGDSAVSRRALGALDRLLRLTYARKRGARHTAGGAAVRGLLQDQVQLAAACLAAYGYTGKARYLGVAQDLADVLDRDFADSSGGGYFDTVVSDPAAPAVGDRAQPVLDDLLPRANAWAARVPLPPPPATRDVRYRRRAEAPLGAFP